MFELDLDQPDTRFYVTNYCHWQNKLFYLILYCKMILFLGQNSYKKNRAKLSQEVIKNVVI